MKRKQKRVLALLLACMMMCIPAAQVMAASTYEVTSDQLAGSVLFPGDSLTGIAEGTVITKTNGDQITADGSGTWKNESEGKAVTASYTAGTEAVVSVAEDGTEVVEAAAVPASIQLNLAGYVLIVVKGTSETALTDGSGTTNNHYQYTDEERASQEAEGASKDKAFYKEGETVKITAAAPDEGYVFAGWTVETSDDVTVTLADAASAETTFTMPKGKVTVTATYTQQTEAVTEATEAVTEATEAAVETTEAAEAAEIAEITEAAESEKTSNANEVVVVDVTEETTAETAAETTAETAAEEDAGIAATAELVYATLTVNYDTGAESYAKTESATYAAGDTVTLTAEDLDGYTFSGWYISSLNVTVDDLTAQTISFTMPETDVTILATYSASQTETTAETTAETAAETEDNNIMVVLDEGGATPAAEPAATYTYSLTQQYIYSDGTTTETVDPSSAVGTVQTSPNTEVSFNVTAPTKEGYEFDAWTVISQTNATASVTATDTNSATITVTLDTSKASDAEANGVAVTVQANYNKVYTVTVEGCSASATTCVAGSTVTITPAEASTGYEISGLTISVNGTSTTVDKAAFNSDGTYTLTMPAGAVTVTTNYTPISYNVTVLNGTTGNVESTSTNEYNSTVTITAAGSDGYVFDHWTVADGSTAVTLDDSNSASTTFTMPAGDVTLTAVYAATYTVNVSNGLISETSTTSGTFEAGTEITITANAASSGQEFSGWTVSEGDYDLGESASSTTITVTVNQNLSLAANYTGVKYSVMVTSGSADYTETTAGTTVTITADAPATGYAFDSWTVGTQNVTLANASKSTTSFTMPSADVSITANYKRVQYSVTVENGNANATYFYYGDTVTISSNYPASGKVFSAWTATSGNVTFTDASKATTTFTMPASNVTISATYEDAPTGADNYISGIEEGGSYLANDKLTFTPVGAGMSNTDPNPGDVRYVPTGYTIGNVSNTWSSAPYETSMSIKKTGEYTLTVTFAREVYDGTSWVADGTTTTTSVTFNIVESLESVQTGDDTPIMQVVAIAVVACLIFIVLLVVFIRRRKRDE